MNAWRWIGVLLVAVPVVALLAFGLTRDAREIPSPLPGRPAPEFALTVMDMTGLGAPATPAAGDTVRLGDHRGDVVVLNFWASWCLACRDEHRALSQAADAYRDRGVHFYGVLYNDSPGNAQRWILGMGGQRYPTLLDPGSRTAIDYGLYGVPETFFIGRDGRVAHKHVGPVTPALLDEWIEGLLAEPAELGR